MSDQIASCHHKEELFLQVTHFTFQKTMNSLFEDGNRHLIRDLFETKIVLNIEGVFFLNLSRLQGRNASLEITQCGK